MLCFTMDCWNLSYPKMKHLGGFFHILIRSIVRTSGQVRDCPWWWCPHHMVHHLFQSAIHCTCKGKTINIDNTLPPARYWILDNKKSLFKQIFQYEKAHFGYSSEGRTVDRLLASNSVVLQIARGILLLVSLQCRLSAGSMRQLMSIQYVMFTSIRLPGLSPAAVRQSEYVASYECLL